MPIKRLEKGIIDSKNSSKFILKYFIIIKNIIPRIITFLNFRKR